MEKSTGMVQYFYHSPSSKLPIRDVLNEQGMDFKLEPHIEAGAENLLTGCYQRNIAQFAKSSSDYLFLLTSCANPSLAEFCYNQYIVGYILKQETGEREGRTFVRGDTFLFNFRDSVLTKDIFGFAFNQIRLSHQADVDAEKTSRILNSFSGKENILEQCIEEIDILDSAGNTCYPDICGFKAQCLRAKNYYRTLATPKSCGKR